MRSGGGVSFGRGGLRLLSPSQSCRVCRDVELPVTMEVEKKSLGERPKEKTKNTERGEKRE